jgi:uncharacterized membrane protein YgdD (TMEM256/DUF423 family)
MNSKTLLRISAIIGCLAVVLGAFGAHGLEKTLEANDQGATWETAVFYHFIHAIMLWIVADRAKVHRGAWWCFFIGILIFSGTLYTLSLTNIKWLGAITPFGGLSLIIGWAMLAIKPGDKATQIPPKGD